MEDRAAQREPIPLRQAWSVSITPQQRLELVQMMASGSVVQGREQMKIFSRFKTAFGLDVILDAAEKGEGQVNAQQAQSRKSQQHLLTHENVEFFLKVFVENLRMNSRQATMLEPLIESLEALLKGEPGTPVDSDVPEYDPAAEQWVRGG